MKRPTKLHLPAPPPPELTATNRLVSLKLRYVLAASFIFVGNDYVSYTKTTSHVNAGYNQLHSWEITLDPYAMVDRIIDGPIATGNTVTTSGVTRTITFTLESTNARKVVGTVGTVYVKAESGATETHVLAINN